MSKKDVFGVSDTTFTFVNKTLGSEICGWYRETFPHYGILYRILNMLTDNGFEISNDKSAAKVIRKDYFVGQKGELKFKAIRYPRGFEITFYQDVSHENPNGGFYDFEKLDKMPYLIRLQYMKYMKKIVQLITSNYDVKDATKKKYKMAEDKIKADYATSRNHPQTDMNFTLSDLDGQTTDDCNALDRDKKIIHNGDIKYFRSWDGRIYRGKVYYNTGNMWWVITNKYEIKNLASFELFDLSSDDYLGRQKTHRVPDSYKNMMTEVKKTSTKILINELKQRGFKMAIVKKIN